MSELVSLVPQIAVALVMLGAVFFGVERMKKTFSNGITKADFNALRGEVSALRQLIVDHMGQHTNKDPD